MPEILKWKEGEPLPGVIVREEEPFEQALKRFKKQVERNKILSEVKKREFYEKPGVRRRKKLMAAKKRFLKKLKKMRRYE